jgi:YfiH family protein
VPPKVVARRAALRETRIADAPPLYAHGPWWARFPWLFQATTGRGDDDAYDFRLFGPTPSGIVIDRWLELRRKAGFERAVHARQVHGADILAHSENTPGLLISERIDGHVTATGGILLGVSIADCVPVSIVAERPRAIALLHAGWRGTAAGVLEAGIERVNTEYGAPADALHVHMGPAICGKCYEVGPEVFTGLGLKAAAGPAPIDLRGVLVERAVRAGVDAENITVSAWCTRCDDAFFSHRAGHEARQVSVLGIRA